MWSRFTLGDNYSPTATNNNPEQEIIRRGPYRWFDHPIYYGIAVMIVGVLLAFHVVYSWITLLIYIAAVWWRIHVEEKALRERFPKDYA